VIAYQYVASLSVEAPTVVVNGSALVAAAEPPPVPAPDATDASATPGGEAVPLVGGVTLTAPVELQVFKDGELLGATGSPLALPVGTHVLDVVNEALGYSGRQRVDVQSGQMSAIAVRVPRGRVSINAVPWADVLIDGAEAGQTPLANLSLTIGEHEIVFRHPELGEQRQVAVVTADGVTRVSAVFRQ
jgi:hypothetical protein